MTTSGLAPEAFSNLSSRKSSSRCMRSTCTIRKSPCDRTGCESKAPDSVHDALSRSLARMFMEALSSEEVTISFTDTEPSRVLLTLSPPPRRKCLIPMSVLSEAMPGPLATTTIGSLPRFSESIDEALGKAVEFQRAAGLDLLADGEQRTDMITYFAEAFEGLQVRGGFPVVTGRIGLRGAPDEFTKVKDLDIFRRMFPDITPKVAITGPTTLGMTCASRKVESHYRGLSDFSLYQDSAAALAPIAKALADRGAYVQIDEPFLSQGFKDLPERVALLDEVARGLPRERVSVHVCGFIGRFGVVGHLLRLRDVSTLSFGFAGRLEEPNIGHVERPAFEEHGKRLGAGCISVTPMSEAEVHTPEQVRSRLADICGRVGRENVAYAHPDCGLRATKKELVPIILRNMRAGVDLFG